MDIAQFEARKRDHIRHALNSDHQATGLSGLDRIHLVHEALPDLDFEAIKLESSCLGKRLPTPFYIAGMTAGHADAIPINRALARACYERGWALGIGSQRRDIEASASLEHWADLRAEFPELMVFANLGISQIITAPRDRVHRLLKSMGAQALVIHANALQEALQPEGTPRFKGAMQALRSYCRELGLPVVLKETGCGFSAATLERLAEIGLAAIDVSGLGGTHWGRIEGARAAERSPQAIASETFRNWGESTSDAVQAARATMPKTEIWASGGVRSGLDAAKLIALGAHRVGYAKPALEAALQGAEQLRRWMELQEFELRVAMFCTGCSFPNELRNRGSAILRGEGY